MEIKFIKELMAVMGRTGLKRLSLKVGDSELTLERDSAGKNLENIDLNDDNRGRSNQVLLKASELPVSASSPMSEQPPKAEASGVFIPSPMVGTFYSTPAPDEPPFVKIGDRVEKHTVVGIVEAMKVLNEIKAGVTGTVSEILVDSGQPVEFGTKLFRVI